jgi:hypothetical protein
LTMWIGKLARYRGAGETRFRVSLPYRRIRRLPCRADISATRF